MKAKSKLQVTVIKSVLADIVTAEKSGNKIPAISAIIQKAVKKRQESQKIFEDSKRLDLAENEQKEIQVLLSLLPKQLSRKEMEPIVDDILTKNPSVDFGGLMKLFNADPRLDVSIAPRKTLSEIAKEFMKVRN